MLYIFLSSGEVFFFFLILHWKHMLTLFYFLTLQVFKEEKYLKEAMECSDVIWHRGLLRKGYGICHGTAGNGYSFLSLYHLTQDKKYLYRACKVRTPLSPQLQTFPGQTPKALLFLFEPSLPNLWLSLFLLAWSCSWPSVPVGELRAANIKVIPKNASLGTILPGQNYCTDISIIYVLFVFWRVWTSTDGPWFCSCQGWPRTLISPLPPSSRVTDLWHHTQLI